jgi:hypothetical protein
MIDGVNDCLASRLKCAAVPAAPLRVWVGLCACDRAGLRPLWPLPPPAPSPLIQEMLASKLDIIAKLSRKFPAEPGSIFTGNAMLAGTPGRAWALALK